MTGSVQVLKNHINIKEPCVKEKASVITVNHLYVFMETFSSDRDTSYADLLNILEQQHVSALTIFLKTGPVLIIYYQFFKIKTTILLLTVDLFSIISNVQK